MMIDKPEMKINLVDEVDDKVNYEANEHKKRAAYLVSIITIITIAYNSQIYKYHGMWGKDGVAITQNWEKNTHLSSTMTEDLWKACL